MSRKAKKYKFEIGTWVKIKRSLKVVSYDGERYCIISDHRNYPVIGIVGGAIVRKLGKIINPSWDEGRERAYLKIEKSLPLYQIKTGMINKPIEVLEEDLEPLLTNEEIRIPWFHTGVIQKSLQEYFKIKEII